MIASVHGAAALHIGATVVAVASRDPRRAITLTEQVGGQAVLFDELPAGADVVVVCTPPAQHLAHALHAINAGVHVVVEKPLCTTLADADRLVDATAAADVNVVYGENLLHAPVIEALLGQVRSLGDVTLLEIRTMQGLPEWGDFTTAEWGGGALFDLGAHPLALALQIATVCGAGDPVSVRADMRGGSTHRSDEHADVHLEFASGLVAHVIASWQAGPTPVWDVQASSATGVVRAEVLPTMSLERNGEPVVIEHGGDDHIEGPLGDFGYAHQLRRALGGGHSGTVTDVELGRRVLDVTCGAYASAARAGDRVGLPYAGSRDRTPLQILRS
jgi:myo-inositol 2-dehydrogenase / D-chiro-inositol 1-dehydrogenase